jgi:hypothetical protein
MRAKDDLTAEYVRSILSYDPETGSMTWLKSRGTKKAGSKAGCVSSRYIKIGIDGRLYPAHRIAILIMTGDWPNGDTDHSDLDKINNKWENIRPSSRSQNRANTAVRPDNKLGVKGIRMHKGTYEVRVKKNGKTTHIYCKTLAEAMAAHRGLSSKMFGEFARFE